MNTLERGPDHPHRQKTVDIETGTFGDINEDAPQRLKAAHVPFAHSRRTKAGVKPHETATTAADVASGAKDQDKRSVIPSAVTTRFLQTGHRFYYRPEARALAFEDKGGRLTTPHNDPAVIRSMVDIAEARGWMSIKARGSSAFRRELWLEASRRHIDVQGFKPKAVDVARLEEIQKEARRPHVKSRNDVSHGRNVPGDKSPDVRSPLSQAQDAYLTTLQNIMRERGDSERAVAMAREIAKERMTSESVYVGRLIDHGTAPYLGMAHNASSHYIKLATAAGEKTVWGRDLSRALDVAGVTIGDEIVLSQQGQRRVSVTEKIRDDEGAVLRTKQISASRNSWEIQRLDAVRSEALAQLERLKPVSDRQPAFSIYDGRAPARQEQDLSTVTPARARERQR